ncbi:MAG: protoporphyrinogen oxidase [Victivallaceae bacterium]
MIKKIVILGAGISGLTTAWLLKKKYENHVQITILEKSSRAGGMIRTEYIDNFVLESGPNAFLVKGKGEKTLKLINDLDINRQLLPSEPTARKRYLHYQGKTYPFNLFLLSKMGLFSSLIKDLRCKKHDSKDETLKEFLYRHCSQTFVQTILSPVITAVKAGDIDLLSSRATFPTLKNWENHYGSLIKGALCNLCNWKSMQKKTGTPSLFSLKDGMNILTDTLSQKMSANLKTLFHTSHISFNPDQTVSIHSSEETVTANLLISCVPLSQLQPLLQPQIPLINRLAEHIVENRLTCASFGWSKTPLLKRRGYGMLVKDSSDTLGFLWNSDIFPDKNKGKTQISVLMSGTKGQEEGSKSLSDYLKISLEPQVVSVSKSKHGIPQRLPGFMSLLSRTTQELPSQLIISGQDVTGPGVNTCISNAYELVENGIVSDSFLKP